jgi:hypothetical protein
VARHSETVIFGRRGTSCVAMVAIPSEPGRWFVVSRAVVVVACPKCGSERGEPCRAKRAPRKAGACEACRRTAPIHRAGVCRARADAYRKLGGNVYPERVDHTRCAACGSKWAIDPGTAVCPVCHAPRTAAAHYAKVAA